jgi:hypothetical protein
VQLHIRESITPVPGLNAKRDCLLLVKTLSPSRTDLPDGLFFASPVHPSREKFPASVLTQIIGLSPAIPSHQRGVSRSSRTLVRDTMDASAPLTNGADADGEAVWS